VNFEPGITAGQCYKVGQELKFMIKRLTKIAPLDAHIFSSAHVFLANESVGSTLERAVSTLQRGFAQGQGFQLAVIILPADGGDDDHRVGRCRLTPADPTWFQRLSVTSN
jgi:hypothetical protein